MPREALDAPQNLPEEVSRQVVVGRLQSEVPGMPNEAATRLEQALLKARQRPALDGERQGEPTEQIAEVVGDDPEQEADLVRAEAMAREASPVGGGLAFLDPLFGSAPLVVEADDGPVRPGQAGDDEAHAGEEFAEVMLDSGDHAARLGPRRCLIFEAPIADQRRVARSAARSSQQIPDLPLQHIIGGQADRVAHAAPFQGLVERGQGKRRVRADDDGLALRAVAVNDGEEHVVPPVRAVDIARPERGREAVALRVEDEERVVADGLKVAVVRRPLLRSVDGALGAVDVEDHPPGR